MKIPSARCDRAAYKWCQDISEKISPDTVSTIAIDLARAAFYLYHLEWPGHDIADWKFPEHEANEILKYRHKPSVFSAFVLASFNGASNARDDESHAPWNLLLREALKVIFLK